LSFKARIYYGYKHRLQLHVQLM